MHDRYILLHRFADLNESKRLILDTWTENFPDLKDAYWLKERFFNIWLENNRDQAETAFHEWKACIPPHLEAAFQPLLTAVTNWHEPIFAYFDHGVSNAYTEALNGLIKTAQRNARGFSFEVLRAKVLETGGFQRTARPAYRERKPAQADVLSHNATSDDIASQTALAIALPNGNGTPLPTAEIAPPMVKFGSSKSSGKP